MELAFLFLYKSRLTHHHMCGLHVREREQAKYDSLIPLFVSHRNLLTLNKTTIDWFSSPTYHTPTKPTAKDLEDMVNSHLTRNSGSNPFLSHGHISNGRLGTLACGGGGRSGSIERQSTPANAESCR